jgi:hypothetical protein
MHIFDIDNNILRQIIFQRKRRAAELIRAAKLNGDVKNIHKYCAAIGISTAIYYSIVRDGNADFVDPLKALDVIDNIEKIQSGEIKA